MNLPPKINAYVTRLLASILRRYHRARARSNFEREYTKHRSTLARQNDEFPDDGRSKENKNGRIYVFYL